MGRRGSLLVNVLATKGCCESCTIHFFDVVAESTSQMMKWGDVCVCGERFVDCGFIDVC